MLYDLDIDPKNHWRTFLKYDLQMDDFIRKMFRVHTWLNKVT